MRRRGISPALSSVTLPGSREISSEILVALAAELHLSALVLHAGFQAEACQLELKSGQLFPGSGGSCWSG